MAGLAHQSFLLLIIVVAIGIGWYLGRRQYRTRSKGVAIKPKGSQRPSRATIRLLIDSYSDTAMDRLVNNLDVSAQTLPIHLSIGRHFRQEGEVDRAILIHQNLLAHPQLNSESSNAVIYELAHDYKTAGLYDRAESLLVELIQTREYCDKARRLLLTILEKQKDWEQAIGLLTRWDCSREPELANKMAHYHCELALESISSNAYYQAQKHLKVARKLELNNPRVQLMFAQVYFGTQDYPRAIKELRSMMRASPKFISEALPLLFECSHITETEDLLFRFLQQLYNDSHSDRVLIALVPLAVSLGYKSEARQVLEQHLKESPSSSILRLYVQTFVNDHGVPNPQVDVLKQAIVASSEQNHSHLCSACGYKGPFYWQCPSCLRWESVHSVLS